MKLLQQLLLLMIFSTTGLLGQVTVMGKVEHISLDGKDSLGNITLAVSSGTPPYNYAWNKGFYPYNKDRVDARNELYTVTVKSQGVGDSVIRHYSLGYKVQWGNFNGTENKKDTLRPKGTSTGTPTARSVNILRPNKDGWAELVLSSIANGCIIGFLDSASVATPGSYFDMDFAFQLTSGGSLYGFNGTSFTYLGNTSSGDVLRIERKDTRFYLVKNGSSIYDRITDKTKSAMIKAYMPTGLVANMGCSFADSTTSLPITINTFVDHFKNDGLDFAGKILPQIKGGSTPYSYKWLPGNSNSKDQQNASQNTFTLIVKDFKNDSVKYYYSLGYKSSWLNLYKLQSRNDSLLSDNSSLPGGHFRNAVTENVLKKNTEGWMEWVVSPGGNYVMGFLDSIYASYSTGYLDIDFGFMVNSENKLYAYSGGSFIYLSTVKAGDVLKVGRDNSQFYLRKNNTSLYTATNSLWTKKLKVKSSFTNGPVVNLGCSFGLPLNLNYKTGPIKPEKPNSGYISVSPYGGKSPYTYLWNNSSSEKNLLDVLAGIYTVTVTDAALDTITASITVGSEMYFTHMRNLTQNEDGDLVITDPERSSMALTNSYIPENASGFYQFQVKDINTNFNFVLNPYDTLTGANGQAPIIIKESIVSIARTSLPPYGTTEYYKINFADTITTGTHANVIQKEFFSDTCTVGCSRLLIPGIQFDYGKMYVLSDGVTIQNGFNVSNNSSIKLRVGGGHFYVELNGNTVFTASKDGEPNVGVIIPRTPRIAPPGTGVSGPPNTGVNPSTFEGCNTCSNDVTRNFSETTYYDDQGAVVGNSRTYYDWLGKETQSQVKNLSENNILVTQLLYDAYGRKAAVSLPAPVNYNCFCYKSGFIKNNVNVDYSYNDFDVPDYTGNTSIISVGEVSNPKPVGNYAGTLGRYYNYANTVEKYVPEATTPYSRVHFSCVDPSSVYRSSKPGSRLNAGSGHETYNFKMATMGELHYFFGPNKGWRIETISDFFGNDPCANILTPLPLANTAPSSIKSISLDENGNESVTFLDVTGNVIATCLSGKVNGGNVKTQTMKSWLGFGDQTTSYIDVHVPDGCENSVSFSPHQPVPPSGSVTYNVIDLKTGRLVLFSGSPALVHTYNTTLQPTLPAGYYRIMVKSKTSEYTATAQEYGTAVTQNLNYYNFALYYYDYANRLKASVSPKGFDQAYVYSASQNYNNGFFNMRSINYTGNVVPNYPEGKTWSLSESGFVNTVNLDYGAIPENKSKNLGLRVTIDAVAPNAFGHQPGISYGDSRVMANTTAPASRNYFTYLIDTTKKRVVIPQDTIIVSRLEQRFKVKIALLDASNHTVENSIRESKDLKCTISFSKDSTAYFSWEPAVFKYEQEFLNPGSTTLAASWAKLQVLEISPIFSGLGSNSPIIVNMVKDLVLGYNAYETTPHQKPEHKMVERYRYNSWGQLLHSMNPDKGQSDNLYSYNGKLKFTQNAKQNASHSNEVYRKYSYVIYDFYDRPINSGEYQPSSSINGFHYFFQNYYEYAANPLPTYPAYPIHNILETTGFNAMTANAYDQVTMAYDRFDPNFYLESGLSQQIYVQRHMNGKLSYSYNNQKKSWYSYDEQGRTEWVVQKYFDVNPAGLNAHVVKTFNYKYDYLGNVIEVIYDKEDAVDRLHHYYEYDQNKRLKRAYISRNGNTKAIQARYDYYLHGPLKRVELANKLQATDYVYTINGWLKSMNGSEMDENHDPGKDGYLTEGLVTTTYKDLYGQSMEYFLGDYVREGTYVQSYDDSQNAATFAPDQFNGIIKAQRWQTRTPSSITGLSYANQQLIYGYEYDKKYQLIEAQFGTVTQNGNQNMRSQDEMPSPQALLTSLSNDYRVNTINYDDNGNLLSLNRRAYNASPSGLNLDYLTYTYASCTNRLTKVSDAVVSNPYNSLGFKPGQGNNNYTYNEIGQLVTDVNDSKRYEYDSFGNIIVLRDASNNLLATYDYDERGYRVKKTTYLISGMKKYTWYVRGPEGNIASVFEKISTANNINYGIPTEWNIYAGNKLGVIDNTGGTESYIYELNDHLSNVRATFKKINKTNISTNFNGTGADDNWFNKNYSLDLVSGSNYAVRTALPLRPYGAGTKLIPVKNGNSISLNWKTMYPTGTTPQAGITVKLCDAAGNTLPASQIYYPMGGAVNTWVTQFATYNVTANYPEMFLVMTPSNQDPSNKIAWFDDYSITFNSGGVDAPDPLNIASYYPHGSVMPGLNFNSSFVHKYGYQGAFAEMDVESNENFFELRNYNSLIGRFATIDPYGQYHSPYLGMANNGPNMIDPDGGFNPSGAIVGAAIGYGVGLGVSIYGDIKGKDYSAAIPIGTAVGALIGGGFHSSVLTVVENNPETFALLLQAGGKAISLGQAYTQDHGLGGTTSNPNAGISRQVNQLTTSGRGGVRRNMQDWINQQQRIGYQFQNATIEEGSAMGSDMNTTLIYTFAANGIPFATLTPPAGSIGARQTQAWQGNIPVMLNSNVSISLQRIDPMGSGSFDACMTANFRIRVNTQKTTNYRTRTWYGIKLWTSKN